MTVSNLLPARSAPPARLATWTAIAALLAALAPLPSQANIVYNVNFGGITGTIETDGAIGALGPTDYVGFNLTYAEPGFSTHASGTTVNVSCFGPCSLSATASALSLITSTEASTRFSDAGDPGNGINIAYVLNGGNYAYITASNANGDYRTPLFNGSSFADFGTASTVQGVPEPGALSLVAAGLTGVAVARRRRKG